MYYLVETAFQVIKTTRINGDYPFEGEKRETFAPYSSQELASEKVEDLIREILSSSQRPGFPWVRLGDQSLYRDNPDNFSLANRELVAGDSIVFTVREYEVSRRPEQ